MSIGWSTGPGSLNWIANNIPNTNSYNWTVNVGNTTNTQFKIWMIGYQTGTGSVTDESDNFFSVHSIANKTDLEIFKLCFGKYVTAGDSCFNADFDTTGFINFADLALLKSGVYDFNGDLIADLRDTSDNADLNFMKSCLGVYTASSPSCTKADLVVNGVVNASDLAKFKSAIKYDLNGDSKVDFRESVIAIPTVTSFTTTDSSDQPGAKVFSWTSIDSSSVDFIIDCANGLVISSTDKLACGVTLSFVPNGQKVIYFENTTNAPINITAAIRAVGSSGYSPASKNVYLTIPPTTNTGGLPDPVVVKYHPYSPTFPTVGEKIRLISTIKNIGTATTTFEWKMDQAGGFSYYVSPEQGNTCAFGVPLGVGQSCDIAIDVAFSTPGTKLLSLTIDPNGKISELDETNNVSTRGVQVSASCPTGQTWNGSACVPTETTDVLNLKAQIRSLLVNIENLRAQLKQCRGVNSTTSDLSVTDISDVQNVQNIVSTVSIITVDELQKRITLLLNIINRLNAQIWTCQNTTTTPPTVTPPIIQPPTIQPPVIQPPVFTERNLYRGMRGDGVRKLQELLAKDPAIYPSGETTGYYGFLTQAAVQNFQCKYGLVCSGDPESTGYGVVGPKTMAKINEVASNMSGGSTGNSGTVTSPPQSGNTVADLQAQIKSLMEQVSALTAKLNALPR